jgi:hypothetical protein
LDHLESRFSKNFIRRREIRNKSTRGAKSISIEITSGPGEKTAENTEREMIISLHLLPRKADDMIPSLPKRTKTTGS